MIYVTCSTKGGTGKSSISAHLLTAFIKSLKKDAVIDYFEIDDQNKSIASLNGTKILNSKIVNSQAIGKFVEDAAIRGEDAIIDVGGNLTTANTLQALNNIGGFYVDVCYFVPMLDTLQDIKNAQDTKELIRKFDKDNKIFFLLNRAINRDDEEVTRDQFIFYFGSEIMDIPPMALDNNCTHLVVNNDTVYKFLGLYGQTMIELTGKDNAAEIKEALKKKDQKRARKLIHKKKVLEAANKIMENEYQDTFKSINAFLQHSITKGDE